MEMRELVLWAELEELVRKWRREADEGDTEENCFKTDCADELDEVLTRRRA